MRQQDFTTAFSVEATPQQVFDAINQVRAWWSENIDGPTDRLNEEFYYHYQDVHQCRIKVTGMQANKQVVWQVLENHFKFIPDDTEWKDTRIVFEITEKAGRTHLSFTHQGLVPACACYQVCHDAWTHYIQDSLKALILTGKGKPTPKETGGTQLPENAAAEGVMMPLGIHHRLLIEKPAEIVYEALTTQKGLAAWWTPDTTATPEAGTVSRFAFEPNYYKEIKVEVLQPYSYIQWRCLKAFEDWIGTTISFRLEAHAKGTLLVFHHEGWQAYSDEVASCSYDWALFLRSLKFLCETGKGWPYPYFNQ